MTEKPQVRIVDLTGMREEVVNFVIDTSFVGSIFRVVLGATRVGVNAEGQREVQHAIVARLNFDVEMAQNIRNALDNALASLAPPPDGKTN